MKLNIDPRAEALDTYALQCRSENHHWKRVGELVVSTTRKGIVQEIQVDRVCPLCDTIREDIYKLPTFELVKRRYRAPASYRAVKMKGYTGRVSRQSYRAAYLARALKELLSCRSKS